MLRWYQYQRDFRGIMATALCPWQLRHHTSNIASSTVKFDWSLVISCECRPGHFRLLGSLGADTCFKFTPNDIKRQQILLIWKMEGQHFIVLRKLFVALVAGQVVHYLVYNTMCYSGLSPLPLKICVIVCKYADDYNETSIFFHISVGFNPSKSVRDFSISGSGQIDWTEQIHQKHETESSCLKA